MGSVRTDGRVPGNVDTAMRHLLLVMAASAAGSQAWLDAQPGPVIQDVYILVFSLLSISVSKISTNVEKSFAYVSGAQIPLSLLS